MERVVCTRYFVGICHMQVCAVAEATEAEILDVCNKENPSGTTNGWTRVVQENSEEVSMRPTGCESDPKRKHFLACC